MRGEVQITPSTDRETYNTEVATAVPNATDAAKEEVSLPAPGEVITPTECSHGREVQIPPSTDRERYNTAVAT